LRAAACAMAVSLPAWKASVLSPAQQNVIAKKTAKMSKVEKEILAEVSDAGKLAERVGETVRPGTAGRRELEVAMTP